MKLHEIDEETYIKVDDLLKDQSIRFSRYFKDLVKSDYLDFELPNRRYVPNKPGVYIIILKRNNDIIYIGQSSNLKNRLFSDHLKGTTDNSMFRKHIKRMNNLKNEMEISEFIHRQCIFYFVVNEIDRKQFENFLITILHPLFNRSN